MAILRIARKIKTFEYEGQEFGLMRPTVAVQMKITDLMSAYQRSLKLEVAKDKKDDIVEESMQTGDMALMTKTQMYVCENLVVNPADNERVFGEGKENINDIDFDFISAAWWCYSGQSSPDRKAENMKPIFGEDFVKENAIIPGSVVQIEIRRLDREDPTKARNARIALEMGVSAEHPTKPPLAESTTGGTTTYSLDEQSSQ